MAFPHGWSDLPPMLHLSLAPSNSFVLRSFGRPGQHVGTVGVDSLFKPDWGIGVLVQPLTGEIVEKAAGGWIGSRRSMTARQGLFLPATEAEDEETGVVKW